MSRSDILWMGIGFGGQAVFMGRFLVQWIASERKGESIVPTAFWYLSLGGSWLLLSYAVFYLRDPVTISGQLFGSVVYLRNLALVYRKRAHARELNDNAASTPRVLSINGAGAALRRAG